MIDATNILKKMLRNGGVFHSKKYLNHLRETYPTLEPHHIIGSMTGIKLNDYLIVMLTREQHQKEHREPTEFNILLVDALFNLFNYLKEVER
jgi:hypothetical protein